MPSHEEHLEPKLPPISHMHWFPWLQKQLLIHSISTQTPEIPDSYNPNYEVWKKEFERYDLTPDTILIGHSCGGGFLVRYLSEKKDLRVGKVILVAPWIDPFREDTTDFFEFEIDPNLTSRTQELTIFNSNNDYDSIHETVKILNNKISDIKLKEFHSHGHFTYKDMGRLDFPELLEAVL